MQIKNTRFLTSNTFKVIAIISMFVDHISVWLVPKDTALNIIVHTFEGFRPYSVQKAVVKGLTELANSDSRVMASINTPPWGMAWFITNGVSNHQLGYGIDVSLVKVKSKEQISIGNYTSILITDHIEYTMPTQIHELSVASAVFKTAVTSKSATSWRGATLADTMNQAAINLQTYCTKAGLTPLASEWWHFNDLEARDQTADKNSNGNYILTEIFSSIPPKDL